MIDFKRCRIFLSFTWFALFNMVFSSLFPSTVWGSIDDILSGAQVESGNVTFDRPDSNTLIVNASDRSIINFNSFSINEQETVRFVQPVDSASVLGRVLGGSESRLMGSLFSNGEFVLVNPSGIFVGANANINVGSLILSTLNVSSEMYRNGQYTFQKPDGFDPAKIFNEGTIRAADGGHVALLSDSIENRGTIEAHLGTVALGVGKKQTLTFDSLGIMNIVVDEAVARELLGDEQAIKNAGGIIADGGKVVLTAKLLNDTFDHLINNEGVIQATHAEERDGKIVFVSNAGIDNSGTLNTNRLDEKGGAFRSTGTVTGGDAFYDNLDGAANISGSIGSNQTDVGDLIVTGNITLTANNLIFTADSDNDGVGKFEMNVGTTISDSVSGYTLTLQTGEDSNLQGFGSDIFLILDRSGNASTPTYTANAAVYVAGLTINSNTTFDLNGNDFTFYGLASVSNDGVFRLRGNETFSNIASLDTGSGTVEYRGDGDSNADTFTLKDFGADDYYNLRINPTDSNDVFQLGSNLQTNGGVTISQGTLSLASFNLSTEQITNDATLRLRGNETVTSTNGNDSNSGTWEYTGDGDSAVDNYNIAAFDYYNLTINSTDAGDTFDKADGLTVNGAATITKGTLQVGQSFAVTGLTTVNGGTLTPLDSVQPHFSGSLTISSGTVSYFSGMDIDGNFTQSGGTFNATDMTIAGNFSRSGGTFNHNNGVVNFDGADQTITGSTTFSGFVKNVSSAQTLTFEAGSTQTIEGELTLQGASGQLLSLRSSVNGTRWKIDPQGLISGASYLNVKDGYNLNGTRISPSSSTNSGNNIYWFGQTLTWEGGSSTDFNDSANWDVQVAPTEDDDVIIPNVTNDPIFNSAGATVTNLTIQSGGILDLNGYGLTVTGTVSNSGTVQLQGGETISLLNGNDIDSGLWEYIGVPGGSSVTLHDFGSTDFYNLTINNQINDLTTYVSGAAKVIAGNFSLAMAGTYDADAYTTTVNGNMSIAGATVSYLGGTSDQTFNGNFTTAGAGNFSGEGGNVTIGGNLSIDASSFTAGTGNLDINGDLTIATTGTFSSSEATTTVAGDITFGGAVNFTNNGMFVMDGTGTSTLDSAVDMGNDFRINGTSKTVVLAHDLSVGGLSTGADDILNLAGYNLDIYTAFVNAGTLKLQGNETITYHPGGPDVTQGTWMYIGDGDGNADSYEFKEYGTTDYFNLVINMTDANDTVFLDQSSTGNINADGTLTITRGITSISYYSLNSTGLATVNGGTLSSGLLAGFTFGGLTVSSGTVDVSAENDTSMDINGNFNQSGGTFSSIQGNLTISGNFTHSGGTFNHSNGTVTLDGTNQTINGSTTFYDLTKTVSSAATLTFEAGTTQTIENTATLKGASGQLLSLRSSSNGTQWLIDPQGTRDIQYVDVKDSNNISASRITPLNSTNSLNNTNWFGQTFTWDGSSSTSFGTAANWDLNSVPTSDDDVIIADVANDPVFDTDYTLYSLTIQSGAVLDLSGHNLTLNSSGTFSNDGTVRLRGTETITNVTQDINSGTWRYVGVSDVTPTTYTIKDFGATDYYNLEITTSDSDLYQIGAATVIAGALTISSGTYKANGNTTTVTGLTTVSGGTYQASTATQTFNGGLTISGGTFTGSSGTVDINGNLTLSSGTLTAPSGTFTIDGNWTNSGGTFSANAGTVTFDKGSGTQTVTETSNFNHLTHSGAGTLQVVSGAIAMGGTLTNSAGTFDLNGNNITFYAGGSNFSNDGTFKLRGSETTTGLAQDTDSGTWFYAGDGDSAADSFTIKDFGGTDYYDLIINSTDSNDTYQSGDAKVIAGTFTVSSGIYDINSNTTTVAGLTTVDGGTYNANGANQTFNGGLTISSGTFTAAAEGVDVNGDFAQSGGTFTATGFAGSFTISGNFSNTGGSFVHNSGTVTFDGSSNQTLTTGGVTFNNITLNNAAASGSDRLIVSGNLDVNGNLTLTDGDLRLSTNNPNVNTAGNVSVAGTASVTKGSGTWTFDGSGTSTLDGYDQDFGDVTVDGSSKTLQLTNSGAVFGTLTIGADDTFDLHGEDVTITTLSNNNIFQLYGNETVTLSTNDSDSGTWYYTGDGDGLADTFSLKDFGGMDYFNLVINMTDSNDTLQNGAAKAVAGALTLTRGIYDANNNTTTVNALATVNGGTYQALGSTQTFNAGLTISSGTFTGGSGTVDVNGNLSYTGGTLTAPSGNLQISGDFNNSGGSFSHNSGTIVFDGTNDQSFTPGAAAYNHITLNNTGAAGSDRLVLSANLDVDGDLTITDGNLKLNLFGNPNVNTSGNVTVGASGSVTKGSGTWTFDGSGTSTLAGNGQDFGNVTVNGTSKTLQLTTSSSTFDTLTVGADDVFDFHGVNATIATLSNNNIVQLYGNETITLTNNDTDSGTWYYTGDGDSAADTFTIKDFGAGSDYYNLRITSTDANDTFQSGAAKQIAGTLSVVTGIYDANGNTTTVTGAAAVNGGSYLASTATQTFNTGLSLGAGTFTGSSGRLDVNGTLSIAGGTFTSSSGNLQVSGNFAHSGGTFNDNNGTVILDGTSQTVSGSTSFNNLTKTVSSADTLTFTQGTTQTVTGTLTLQGASGNLLSLRSSSNGTAWNIDPSGTVVADYLDVKDSNNMNTAIYVTNGNDSLGNTNWDFGSGGGGGGTEVITAADPVEEEKVVEEVNRTPIVTTKDPVEETKFEDPKNEKESRHENKTGTDPSVDPKTGPNTETKNDPKGGGSGIQGGGSGNAPKEKKVVTYVFVEEGAVNVSGDGEDGTMVYPGENIKYGANGQKQLQTRGIYVVTGDQVKGLRRTKYGHEVLKGEFRWAENPSALAASHDGTMVYVVLPKSGKVATIQTQQQELGQDIRGLDDGASNILMSPDDKRAFVADNVKDEIMVMNLKEQKVERTIATRARPAGIQITKDGKTLFVANEWDGSISQIDPATGKETGLLTAGKAPYALALSKDEKQLFATDRAEGKVLVFTKENGSFKLEKEIAVGDAPTDVALAPEGGILFVTNRNSQTVAVVDVREGKVLQNMTVGQRPTAITVTPEGYGYVANELSGTVSHLDLAQRKVIEDIPAGTAPRRVVISTPPQRAIHPKAA